MQKEEQARAMKRLEEEIPTLQTYADESGSGPVMWWETDLTKRSAHSTGIIRSLGLAVPQCILCVCVCVKLKNRRGEREWQKEVSVSSLKMYPFSYLWNSQQHLANDFSLISPPHKQKRAVYLWEVGGVMVPLIIYDLSKLEDKKKLSSVSSLITTLTPLIRMTVNSSKHVTAVKFCQPHPACFHRVQFPLNIR